MDPPRFLAWVMLLISVTHACPDYCRCQVEDTVVCSAGQLYDFPYAMLPPATTHLDLADNPIRQLRVQIYSVAQDLESLILRNASLSSIGTGAFTELRNLRHLDLSHNSLTELEPSLFLHLVSLETLILTGNPLSSLPASIFDSLPSLQHLSISSCDLKTLPEGSLAGLRQLRTLDATNNRLERLPRLLQLPELTRLVLRKNRLREIDAASLQELRSLKTLDLSYNELRDLRSECFAEIKKLQYLDLSYNELRRPAVSGWHLPSLVWLDLSHNHLDLLETDQIDSVPALRYLNLSVNPQLTTIQLSAFVDVHNLTELHMADCGLVTLSPSVFVPRPLALVTLNLSANPLQCDCALSSFPDSSILAGNCLSPASSASLSLHSLSPCSTSFLDSLLESPLLLLLLLTCIVLSLLLLLCCLLSHRNTNGSSGAKIRLPSSPPAFSTCSPYTASSSDYEAALGAHRSDHCPTYYSEISHYSPNTSSTQPLLPAPPSTFAPPPGHPIPIHYLPPSPRPLIRHPPPANPPPQPPASPPPTTTPKQYQIVSSYPVPITRL